MWDNGAGHAEPKETMRPPSERREALPDHPVPAGMAAPEAWRLCIDGRGVQPLALSISDIDGLGAQTHTADVVCEEGWRVPEQQWTGVAVAALLGHAGVRPEGRFLKGYAGDVPVLLPLEDALTGGALLARRLNGTPLTPAHGAPLSWPHPSPLCGDVQEGHEQDALRSSWWSRKERTDDERDHGTDSR